MVRTILILSFVLFSNLILSQSIESILKKMKMNYSSDTEYSTNLKYTLYKGHNSNMVHEVHEGRILNTSQGYYQRSMNIEYILTDEFALQIDDKNKTIVYAFPQAIDFNAELQKAISLSSSSSLEETKDYYRITFYYTGFTNSPYSHIEVKVLKNTFLLDSVEMYFINKENFGSRTDRNSYHKPHLSIMYFNYSKKPDFNKEYFNLENYLIRNDKTGMISISDEYKGYELIDERI